MWKNTNILCIEFWSKIYMYVVLIKYCLAYLYDETFDSPLQRNNVMNVKSCWLSFQGYVF